MRSGYHGLTSPTPSAIRTMAVAPGGGGGENSRAAANSPRLDCALLRRLWRFLDLVHLTHGLLHVHSIEEI